MRLTHEIGPTSTGKINGTLTLMKGQQMCVNITAIINVSNYILIHCLVIFNLWFLIHIKI